jgi:2-methylfumaryl-CoA hydratase
MLDFARVFMQCNPLYLNLEYAKAHGFQDLPASPQMVFNVVLSLGVHNDSEKAIANLGYYNVQFLRPVYPGDTLRGYTKVVDRKARGEDKPGIVLIRTLGVNQHNQVVLQYERKIMVGYRGDRLPTTPAPTTPVEFPWVEHPVVDIADQRGRLSQPVDRPQYLFRGFLARRSDRPRQRPHHHR